MRNIFTRRTKSKAEQIPLKSFANNLKTLKFPKRSHYNISAKLPQRTNCHLGVVNIDEIIHD